MILKLANLETFTNDLVTDLSIRSCLTGIISKIVLYFIEFEEHLMATMVATKEDDVMVEFFFYSTCLCRCVRIKSVEVDFCLNGS
jgi:hypothetical protein